jgi:hypothetical protein
MKANLSGAAACRISVNELIDRCNRIRRTLDKPMEVAGIGKGRNEGAWGGLRFWARAGRAGFRGFRTRFSQDGMGSQASLSF